MKTAMQELSDWLNDKDSILSFSGIRVMVNDFIEVEKQQIKDAFNNSSSDTLSNNIPKYKDADQYYQTTFKSNP